MLSCSGCGRSAVADDKYCRSCGTQIVPKLACSGCGESLAPDDRFCHSCGVQTLSRSIQAAGPPSTAVQRCEAVVVGTAPQLYTVAQPSTAAQPEPSLRPMAMAWPGIGKAAFALLLLPVLILSAIADNVARNDAKAGALLWMAAFGSYLGITIPRWRNIGFRGWDYLLMFIPFVSTFIALAAPAGYARRNDPTPAAARR